MESLCCTPETVLYANYIPILKKKSGVSKRANGLNNIYAINIHTGHTHTHTAYSSPILGEDHESVGRA